MREHPFIDNNYFMVESPYKVDFFPRFVRSLDIFLVWDKIIYQESLPLSTHWFR